ncbi:MAG TPA: PEP-CTERM sorting domain-containing protein [Terriglobia bacterium]|nr:PEP-CTERM sorting domain-containing protein [Terriglobia bacterium]
MRRVALAFAGLALLVVSAGVASASTVTVTLTGAGGVISNNGSVFVGPYQLLVGGQAINAPCDDYSDEIWVGESWKANENPLTAAGVSSSLFGSHAGADQLYLEAAYLTSLFGKEPTSDYNDIAYAIWGLFDPAALVSSNYSSGAESFLTQAQDAPLSFSEFNGWQILTPINGSQSQGGRPQEFIIPGGNPSATPEPAALALLGSGLLAVGLAVRKKRASSPLA